ncbi:transcriptional regulator GcvA [Sphingomonas jatrophae]|uniref:DNA-binding transcriptional regulator, LysR family n=1 Tax=Sphingomonas jatrophae TaxID=1166337 RepID=A0A1I6KA58_9SPHN|nr:transcriptional regulator GcvA [Sphingomonas jatrophae]SFR88175.1 DNA-binding transcriptional regulator, LysR family [Sphingomonas jatrophae]
MRRRLLPSLTALRTFEAVARCMSFTEAAGELNVTQSAASRQVRILEEYVGGSLFVRTRGRLELTDEGRIYAAELKDALDRMEFATLQAMAYERGGGVLRVGVLPTFGTRWLIPRLSRFSKAHPKITLNLNAGDGAVDFGMQGIDVAIRFGSGQWPDAVSYRLGLSEEMVVVCSPDLRAGDRALTSPEELRHFVLLQHTTRPQAWSQWLAEARIDDADPAVGPSFEHFFMLIQAAVAGLGVALLPRFLIADELRTGALVAPLAQTTVYEGGYYLICPAARKELTKIRAFRDWLLEESAVTTPLDAA